MEMWSMQTETSGNKVVVLARKKKKGAVLGRQSVVPRPVCFVPRESRDQMDDL